MNVLCIKSIFDSILYISSIVKIKGTIYNFIG